MAEEKSFETKVKNYLTSLGVYPIGTPEDKMDVTPIGYWEKRWGGGRYVKAGLPDMHIVINGINIDAEVKGSDGRPSKLQKQKIAQINNSGSISMVLYPDGFEEFKNLIKGVIECRSHTAELRHLKSVHSSTRCDIMTKYKR